MLMSAVISLLQQLVLPPNLLKLLQPTQTPKIVVHLKEFGMNGQLGVVVLTLVEIVGLKQERGIALQKDWDALVQGKRLKVCFKECNCDFYVVVDAL